MAYGLHGKKENKFMKSILPILTFLTVLCFCHSVYQPLYTEAWNLSEPEPGKTYYLIDDPRSSSFFKNAIEKLELDAQVAKILKQKGYTRVSNPADASVGILATYWLASPIK